MAWIVFALSLLSSCVAQDSLLLQPPSIYDPVRPQTLYYADGERVLVTCKAEGIPEPEYQWQRNGKIIENDNKFIKVDTRIGTLEIPSFSAKDEGVFVCRASNKVGDNVAVRLSYQQTLLASKNRRFKNRDETRPKVMNRDEYRYTSMRCSDHSKIVSGPNDTTYEWYITQDQFRPVGRDNGRIFISSDGTLHFTYTLKKDDSKRKGNYRCGISSMKYRSIVLGPPVVLNVQESRSTPSALRPVMMYNNNGHQGILGTVAELECVFSGYNPASVDKLPVITWYDQAGRRMVSDRNKYTLKNKNRTLRITNLQENDEINYRCQGMTIAGTSRVHTVYLNVTSAPIWVDASQDTTVIEGSNVQFHCNARSLAAEFPPLIPIWFINGQPLKDVGKNNTVLSVDKKVLTLSNVKKPNDILCVHCIVGNSVGQITHDACLNVIEPIKLILDCKKCQESSSDNCTCNEWDISKGDSVEFKITLKSDPAYMDKHTQEWTFNDEVYKIPQLPPFWNRDATAEVYSFNTRNLSDEEFHNLTGKYHFKVYHPYDYKEETITIHVKSAEPDREDSSLNDNTFMIGLFVGVQVGRGKQASWPSQAAGPWSKLIDILLEKAGNKGICSKLNHATELKVKDFHDSSHTHRRDVRYPNGKQ